MDLPYHGEEHGQTRHHILPSKPPGPGVGYTPSTHWSKGFLEIPQTLQATASAIGNPPQHDEVQLVPH